jgi:hypothetical protein
MVSWIRHLPSHRAYSTYHWQHFVKAVPFNSLPPTRPSGPGKSHFVPHMMKLPLASSEILPFVSLYTAFGRSFLESAKETSKSHAPSRRYAPSSSKGRRQ